MMTVLLVKINIKATAAQNEKPIDKTTPSGFRCRSRGNLVSPNELHSPLAGVEVTKTAFMQLRSTETKFETLQTVEEILFANRKTKEKKCSKQLSKNPPGISHRKRTVLSAVIWRSLIHLSAVAIQAYPGYCVTPSNYGLYPRIHD
jgi:hypothetical protein